MTVSGWEERDLAATEALWKGRRPLEAGRALTALVPPAARPRWAGRIVAWAYRRSGRKPEPAIVALLAALGEPDDQAAAVEHRDTVAALLAQTERNGRFDSLHEALLTLALNAARLLVASQASTSPDPKEGWWFVASLKCVADELDESFRAEAWDYLRQIA
jgi:hypothetical protein